MNALPRPRSLVVLLLAALALAASAVPIEADHAWESYHWARTGNPFTLLTGDNVTSNWDPYLDEAISDWNASEVLQLRETQGATNPKNCRATTGRIEVCNSKYGRTGWLGIAQIWISGEHITQAISKLNDTYFDTPSYNKPEWRRLVMCQEIAHDFGLHHQDEVFDNPNLGSCMDYTSNPLGPPSNEHPNLHDFEQLEFMYAHPDSSSTVGTTQPNSANGELNTPAEWGKLIKGVPGRGVAVYARDFGPGQRVLTFVIWA